MNELKYLLVFLLVYVIYRCIYNYYIKEMFTHSANIINVLITQADGSIVATPCISTYCSINCNIMFLTPGSSNYTPNSSNYTPSSNSTDPEYVNNTSGTCVLIPK